MTLWRDEVRVGSSDQEVCDVREVRAPVDVGKWKAMAMVTDLRGEIIDSPFLFDLTVEVLTKHTSRVVADRSAVMCRFGVEAAGHYHRPLVNRLVQDRVVVVELNPYAVKLARAQQLHARQTTDERDLAAMADLLARGAGRSPQQRELAMVEQAAWVAHRNRKVELAHLRSGWSSRTNCTGVQRCSANATDQVSSILCTR